jgi:hypothetical protein
MDDVPDYPTVGQRRAAEEEMAEFEADARSIADKGQEYAVQVKRRSEEHASCPGRPAYDPELGVMCYCSAIIGPPMVDDLMAPSKPLPSSTVTAAAKAAEPLVIEPPETVVKDVRGISSAVHPNDPILSTIEIIDPTQPYTPQMVEEHLLEAVKRQEEGAHYERVCAEDYADKVMRYEIKYNRKRIEARKAVGGAEGDREAWARVECETEYLEREISKLKLKAIQGTMHSLRSVISAYQSVAKSIASAYSGTRNDAPRAF